MPIKPQRILWPTDFSELSLLAGRYARGFRDTFGGELHIVHVITPPLNTDLTVMLPMDVPLAVSEPDLIDAGKKAINALIDAHFDADAAIVRHVLCGNPWTAICEYAQNSGIQLIVIGTHGHTGIRHALIGSTAERIVQHAPCPVLTVKQAGAGFAP
ncbi:MAG: universal stress protein [Phycisphaerae bacterium]